MSDLSRDPVEHGHALGLRVVTPEPDELLLDIDDADSEAIMQMVIGVLRSNGEEVIEHKRTVSQGGNTHVYLKMPKWGTIDPMVRVALQACLGSDRTRELFSILRIVRNYDIPPTVLFERD
jgi:hypothetical protein